MQNRIWLPAAISVCLVLGMSNTIAARADSTSGVTSVCPDPAPGQMTCQALRVLTSQPALAPASSVQTGSPRPLSPANFQSAYGLPSGTAGSGVTIGIVDAYDNPYAESNLATFRSHWGLPPCTTANGCFRKVNQNAQQFNYPAGDSGWGLEISLDLDAVSSACPNCKIVLAESSTNYDSDLYAAVNAAVSLGSSVISMSWGGGEYSSETSDDATFNIPGVKMIASSGDSGYNSCVNDAGLPGPCYPAASPYVSAVGGTTLLSATNTRGWYESTWSGTGSGCSAYESKPTWQSDTGCTKRMTNDIAADADPNTGLVSYDTYGEGGWVQIGGTSLAAPLVAASYALQFSAASGSAPQNLYDTSSSAYFPVTSGTNGSCATGYFCNAASAVTVQCGGWSNNYSGPIGLGTPNVSGSFSAPSCSAPRVAPLDLPGRNLQTTVNWNRVNGGSGPATPLGTAAGNAATTTPSTTAALSPVGQIGDALSIVMAQPSPQSVVVMNLKPASLPRRF